MPDHITLNPTGKDVAATAFMSRQEHPYGFYLTDSTRVKRALWAYQWAMANLSAWTDDGYILDPPQSQVEAAMLEWETAQDV